jgi:hypothetical protein
MDNEKSLLEKLTETMKDAAHLVTEGAMAIAHPTSGTPMDMPLNESGYALTHPHFTQTPAAEKVVKKSTKKPKRRRQRHRLKRQPRNPRQRNQGRPPKRPPGKAPRYSRGKRGRTKRSASRRYPPPGVALGWTLIASQKRNHCQPKDCPKAVTVLCETSSFCRTADVPPYSSNEDDSQFATARPLASTYRGDTSTARDRKSM